jgi:hypothetical protein
MDGTIGSSLFENEDWRVTASGLEHKGTGYWIPREEFAFRREDGVWLWPAQLSAKSWCNAVTAIEALERAALFYGEPDLEAKFAWHEEQLPWAKEAPAEFAPLALWTSPWLDGHLVDLGAHHPDAFARAAIRTICRAGVSSRVGDHVFDSCIHLLRQGMTVRMAFRHPAKADAIDRIWADRHALHRAFVNASDPVSVLRRMPGIGPSLARRLAEMLGVEAANPERRDLAAAAA